MSGDQQEEKDMALIREALNKLSEHFDSVQIFATRHESGELDGTVNITLGTGNWFTRYGHVRSWLVRNDEQERITMRKKEGE